MPTLTLPPFSGAIADALTHQVWVRSLWSDPWVELENLRCERLAWSVAPGLSTASFRWRYGRALAWETGAWQAVPKLSLSPRGFIKVTVAGQSLPGSTRNTRDWVGVWNSAVDHDLLQRFSADGVEVLLSYVSIRDAWYVDHFNALRQAGRGLTFNADGLPNRSLQKQAVNGQQVFVFDTNADRAAWWSSLDIVNYLLAACAPVDSLGTALYTWQLNNPTAVPSYDRPQVETHGRTTWDVLNAVIDRHRITSFWVELYDVPDSSPPQTIAKIQAFTFAETDVALTGYSGGPLGTIPANADQWNVIAKFAQSAQAVVGVVASHVADRVRVTGARRVSVFTANFNDKSLAKGWTAAQETAYEVGASEAVDYPSYDRPKERKLRDAEARSADELQWVYQRFTLGAPWDQRIIGDPGDPGGDTTQRPIALDDGLEQFHVPESELKLLKTLPLRTGYDYSGVILASHLGDPGHRGDAVDDGSHAERAPLALLKAPRTSVDEWMYVDRIGLGAREEIEWVTEGGLVRDPVNRDWSASVRIDADTNAILLNINGAQPHVIASADYGPTRILDGWPAGGPYQEDMYCGDWDFNTLLCTIAVQESRRVEVVYPPESPPIAPLGNFVNEMVIEAGDDYLLIYVVPRTVVDLDCRTKSLVRTDGGVLQDDRDALQAIARRAYEWYSRPRYALCLTTGWFQGDLWLGALITSLVDLSGNVAISSVVSEITIDFPTGSRGTPSVVYATSFAELDPKKLV